MINFGLPKPIYARLCKYMHNVKLDHSIETGAKQKDNFTGEHVGLLQLAPILEFSGYKNRCLRGFPSSPWSSCCTSFVYCRTGRILIKVDLLRMFFCTPAEPRWDSNCNYSQVSRFVCREDPLTPLQKSGQPVKHAPAVASTVPPPRTHWLRSLHPSQHRGQLLQCSVERIHESRVLNLHLWLDSFHRVGLTVVIWVSIFWPRDLSDKFTSDFDPANCHSVLSMFCLKGCTCAKLYLAETLSEWYSEANPERSGRIPAQSWTTVQGSCPRSPVSLSSLDAGPSKPIKTNSSPSRLIQNQHFSIILHRSS